MARISVLHAGNKSSILLVPTILLIIGSIIYLTPKCIQNKQFKSRVCLHSGDVTETGLCEQCGEPLIAILKSNMWFPRFGH